MQVNANGITQIIVYLDGRKLKTLAQAQARRGKFTVMIDPRKLSYGVHRVSIATLMSKRYCPSTARSSAFVRPFKQPRVLKFTG